MSSGIENPDDELLITLQIKRHQLRYRDDGTLYGLWDNIGSAIHIGDGETTVVVAIKELETSHQIEEQPDRAQREKDVLDDSVVSSHDTDGTVNV